MLIFKEVGNALTSPTTTLMICGTSFPGPLKKDSPAKINPPVNTSVYPYNKTCNQKHINKLSWHYAIKKKKTSRIEIQKLPRDPCCCFLPVPGGLPLLF